MWLCEISFFFWGGGGGGWGGAGWGFPYNKGHNICVGKYVIDDILFWLNFLYG